MSNDLRGLARWLLKSTYFEDVQNLALHTQSEEGIAKSSVYTQSAQWNFRATISLI